MPIQLEISPRIIRSIASLYNDVNRIFLEYIDNSLDSAEPFYDRLRNRYPRRINITIAFIGKSYREGKVIIHDNCWGITNLPKVVNSIGDSDKKAQAWTNGEFGYGIYSFMACCGKLEITTKTENGAPYYIPIERGQFDVKKQKDVLFPDPEIKHAVTLRKEEAILFPSDSKSQKIYGLSGTKIILSNFDKNLWKEIDLIQMKTEIEKHFEFFLSRDNFSITLVEKGEVFTCKTFNYDHYEGETYEECIDELIISHYRTKHTFKPKPPIKIFIKVTKGQEINKRPTFISKGRRIAEIKEVKSFRSKNKSNLWDHPNVTGFIDLGDFLGPTIARNDFRNDAKSKAFFTKLIELEPLILDVVREVNKASEERHYRELEDRLNLALSHLAKLDSMKFRTDYLSGGTVNLASNSYGRKDEEGYGEDVPTSNGQESKSKEPVGSNEGDGVGATNGPGSIPGPTDGGTSSSNKEAENPFEDSEFKGRERRKSGFNVRLVDREPDIDESSDKPLRSQIYSGEIHIFRKHPDFEERIQVSRRGKQKITQRLITYLAGEITVHYKDKFYNKRGQPQYNKIMFVDLVDFIYQLESMLSDLAGKNLSDLSE